MDKDLRVSLVAAAAAATLSALVGLVAGVAFLILVLRAVAGGIIIGAAVFGIVLLLRKNMPGLFEATGPDAESQTGADRIGGGIDIVLPEEPVLAESFAPGEPLEEPRSGHSKRRGADSDEDAAELSPLNEDSLLEPEDSGVSPAAPSRQGAEREQGPSSGFDELDVLPDLEGFSDTFTSAEYSSTSQGGQSAGGDNKGYNKGSGSRPGQEGLDPAALAQAVRTILKRDQKG